jgi:hypothetical protein
MSNTVKLYSTFDVKSKLYSNVFPQPSDGVAIRSFASACEDTTTQLNKYAEDFSLHCLGSFNVETGEIMPSTPQQIANASEFVSKE